MTIKEIREKHGYTQQQLSELLGVSIGTIQSWEQNKRKPGRRSKKDIDKIISETVDKLIESGDL